MKRKMLAALAGFIVAFLVCAFLIFTDRGTNGTGGYGSSAFFGLLMGVLLYIFVPGEKEQ